MGRSETSRKHTSIVHRFGRYSHFSSKVSIDLERRNEAKIERIFWRFEREKREKEK